MREDFKWEDGYDWVYSPDGNVILYAKVDGENIQAAGFISPVLGLPRGAKAQWRTYGNEVGASMGFSVTVEAAKEELLRCVFRPHWPLHPSYYRADELHRLVVALRDDVLADCRATEDRATHDALKHLQEVHFLLSIIKHCLSERWAVGSMKYCKPH